MAEIIVFSPAIIFTVEGNDVVKVSIDWHVPYEAETENADAIEVARLHLESVLFTDSEDALTTMLTPSTKEGTH